MKGMTNLRRRRRGFSLIELLIVIAIILIIITVAVPKYQAAMKFARETAVMEAVKTIHSAEQLYYSTYGKYASSLTELGPPASGAPSPAAADFIDGTLGGGIKGGYKFTVGASNGGYVVNANPVTFGVDGGRTFYSDQSHIIRQNFGAEPATINSPETK
jgi:type IV pilus assembly protein PilA